MLGERLRMARLATGLSLEGLAAKLDRPITKQALSKYERGVSEPPLSRIEELAAALNVNVSALLKESAVQIRWVAYRKLARLSKSRQEKISAAAAQRLEGETRLRALFHLGERLDLPGPIAVNHLSDCDSAAATLRMRWNLGDRPVDSLIELIEYHGTAVLAWSEEWGFDGLSGWAQPNASDCAECCCAGRQGSAQRGARDRTSCHGEHRRFEAGRTVRIPLRCVVPGAWRSRKAGARYPPAKPDL